MDGRAGCVCGRAVWWGQRGERQDAAVATASGAEGAIGKHMTCVENEPPMRKFVQWFAAVI